MSKKPRPQKKISKALADQLLLSGSSYRSSLLKLQLDDVLSSSRYNYEKRFAQLEATVAGLDLLLRSLPAKPPISVQDAEKVLRKTSGIEIPFPEPHPGRDTKYTLAFAPPQNVNLVRDFALKTEIKTGDIATVDLAVTIPDSLFQEKDYLDYRYFHKRIYYIACLGAAIQDTNPRSFKISYGHLDGNELQPTLLLEPGDTADAGFIRSRSRIQIITAADSNIFPIHRTLPDRNCVRPSDVSKDHSQTERPPTPFYNATLRSELTSIPYLELLQGTASRCEGFRDSCLLGGIWLRQRGFGSSVQSGGLGGIEWATCCALLLEDSTKGQPILSSRYTSYQLFKAVLQFFARRDLTDPFIVNSKEIRIAPTERPVFYDGLLGVNILFKVQPWSYKRFKSEAQNTLNALNEDLQDAFDAVFLSRVNEQRLYYDHVFTLELPNGIASAPNVTAIESLDKIYQVLLRGLGDRARLIDLKLPQCGTPNFTKKSKNKARKSDLAIRILSRPENAVRLVDRGPTAEDKEAASEFRTFWGDKAELRRFKDGSISESLVWSESSAEGIFHQILSLLLARHFDVVKVETKSKLEESQARLLSEPSQKNSTSQISTANNAFQELVRLITQSDGLPLSLRSIMPSNSILNGTSTESPPDSRPADVLLQFESSNRWPDHTIAIQRTKIAFLSKVAELIEPSKIIVDARVGLEHQSNQLLNQAFLDIQHSSGIRFRLRIHHEREQVLLERALMDKQLDGKTRDETAQALAAYKRCFLQAPQQAQAIKSLCTRHPALATTTRLLKRWFNAHLLSRFLHEEVIELFAARTFTFPYPWEPPSTASTAFLRTLRLLSEWDWEHDPLIVDLNKELTTETTTTIKTNFEAWRKVDPAMSRVTLFVASNLDHSGVSWTQFAKPPRVVAARLTGLARAAMDHVRASSLELDMVRLFKSPLADFDFLLHVKPELTLAAGTRQRAEGGKYKNLQLAADSSSSWMQGIEAVRLFVDEIQDVVGDNALFFYDEDGGPAIGGLWNPRALGTRHWKVRLPFSSRPVEQRTGGEDDEEEGRLLVEINTKGILAEIGLLGEGLIDKVEVLKEVR
ncbi:MAG: hypothetical protein Q9227_001929 [Pyrenula ochraceoflavens]